MSFKKYDSLKTEFSILGYSADDRLIPVNVLVMHDGINYNHSSFSKDVMDEAKETLKNIPILAYIKEDENGDIDFAGHEMQVKLEENKDGELEYKVRYLERPIGVIPETNDYHYQERDGKTYVACKGYLWKEYLNSGIDILKENSIKGVSMEIIVDDGGFNDKTDAYEISKYRYLGITVLGDDIQPAMHQTQMEVVGHFSIKDNKDFFEKVEKLNKELKQSLLEGGESVEKFEEEVVETTEEVTEELTDETTEELEVEELEVEEVEVEETADLELETDETVEETTIEAFEEEIEVEETVEDVVEENFTKLFELSHDDIRSKLYKYLYKIEDEDDTWYYITQVFDNSFIYTDEVRNFKQGYVKTDVDVAFDGERVEMFVEYLTGEELQELNDLRATYAVIVSENEELKLFKADIITQQKSNEIEDLFDKYSTLLDEADFEDLRESATDMDINSLEKELSFRLVQKKFDFSKTVKKDNTRVQIKEVKTENEPYGSASVYFNK